MFGFLKDIFKSKKNYEKEKDSLKSVSVKKRKELASNPKTSPEILYYLADDENESVRQAVAENKSTPVHAGVVLSKDKNIDVRMILAQRLIDLLPDLSIDQQGQLYGYLVQSLKILAEDEVLTIRKALSSALKGHAYAPPKVVSQLARDVEREVAEPVLQCCITLPDDELLDILSGHPEPWVISAIAGREEVSEPVSEGVFNTRDIPANEVLLKNAGANISKDLLAEIIKESSKVPIWQETLAKRPNLSFDMVRMLTGVASEAVLKLLEDRKDFDEETQKEVAVLVKRRMAFRQATHPDESSKQRVVRYAKARLLNGETIQDALAWKEEEFVIVALGEMTGVHPAIVKKIINTQSAKPIVALAWYAKLPMRVAVELQKDLSKVENKNILYAKGGTSYPLTKEELVWQLEFFGIEITEQKVSA